MLRPATVARLGGTTLGRSYHTVQRYGQESAGRYQVFVTKCILNTFTLAFLLPNPIMNGIDAGMGISNYIHDNVKV